MIPVAALPPLPPSRRFLSSSHRFTDGSRIHRNAEKYNHFLASR
jgi:hypothetical protein